MSNEEWDKQTADEKRRLTAKVVALRDTHSGLSGLCHYIPGDPEAFLRIVKPEEEANPLAGSLFPIPLSEKDQKEAVALAEICGIRIPEECLIHNTNCACSKD